MILPRPARPCSAAITFLSQTQGPKSQRVTQQAQAMTTNASEGDDYTEVYIFKGYF